MGSGLSGQELDFPPSTLYGLDGIRDGWVVAFAPADLDNLTVYVESSLACLFETVIDTGALLVIDIPIGLPDDDHRACDREARRRLRFPRSTSVFSAPARPALRSRSYAEACELNENASGRRLSRQSYAILPKIREVDHLMTPELQNQVFEAHPEVTFAELSGLNRGLTSNKKSSEGRAERRALLQSWIPGVASVPARIAGDGMTAQPDDVNDALACLLTAWRIVRGKAITLPGDRVERDGRGLRTEIVA